MYFVVEPMTAFEERPKTRWRGPLLLPFAFRWRDPKTLLVHHGAVVQHSGGHVIGYTTLCTDVLGSRWDEPQPDEPADINCFECLGAREQDE
jgi:hypothetical protein